MQNDSHEKTTKDNELFDPKDDEVFGNLNLLTSSLQDLDDRGLILSLAAFSEEALGELLKAFLIPSKATSQLLEGFNAPLGTFSSRIKSSYSIGLITKEQFFDLERLRKIRNEFAHSWRAIDITSPKISSLIKGMNFSRINKHFPETLKEKVRHSISCLLIELHSSTHQIQEKNMQAHLIGNSLMTGFSGNFESQIQSAREELSSIDTNLASAKGEKRLFYFTHLNLFEARLTVLARPETVKQMEMMVALHLELKEILLKYPN